MKRRITNIFSRILMASVLPFALVFCLVLLAVNHIIYSYHDERVKETVIFFGEQASQKVTDTMGHIGSLLMFTSEIMADTAADSDRSRKALEELLHTFIESNPEIFCAWYVFEGGTVSEGRHWYARSFISRDGEVREIQAVTGDDLNNPGISPWHILPYTTGRPYLDPVDFWDYGQGNGFEFTGTMAWPITVEGRIVGTVGTDILYEQALSFVDQWQVPDERRVIIMAGNGLVLYSPDGRHGHHNYRQLGFTPDDAAALGEAMRLNQPLLKEMRSPFFEEKSLVFLYPIDLPGAEQNLFLLADHPTSRLYRPVHWIIASIGLTGLLGLIILAVGAALATRNIVGPIKRLTGYADRIAHGNLDVRPDDLDEGGDAGHEVDVLRASIKKMLEQLTQNHALKLELVAAEYEKKKVQDSSLARTLFFANMSHEIRTPMNVIMGIADILLDEPLGDRVLKYIRDIKISSESLLVIIDDILDLSKLETGKLALINAHYDLRKTLDNIKSVGAYLTGKTGLSFSLKLNGEVPHFLYGDEARLRQVLINLLSNAVKFTEYGWVRVAVREEGETLCFDVSDTGIGIRPEDQEYIFEAFKQADAQKNRKIKGTGLGLSITRSLVRLMGGEITVDSIYGAGATFHVRLPLTPGNAEDVLSEDADLKDLPFRASARALVVDDKELNLEVATGLLSGFGLSCDTALSGQQAIDKLASEEYDIVFMDHMMPEMDGVETTRRIRAMGGWHATIPIVALTANAVSGIRDLLVSSGMNDYVPKPIQKPLLHRILAKWLPHDNQDSLQADYLTPARLIEGLDVDKGMGRSGRNPELYARQLATVRDNLPDMAEALSESHRLEKTDRLKVQLKVLSGALSDIGAAELATQAAKLEEVLELDQKYLYLALFPLFTAGLSKFAESLADLPL